MFATRGTEFNCPACDRPFGGPPEKYASPTGGIAKHECKGCHQVIRVMECCDENKFAVFDTPFNSTRLPEGIGRGERKASPGS